MLLVKTQQCSNIARTEIGIGGTSSVDQPVNLVMYVICSCAIAICYNLHAFKSAPCTNAQYC